MGTTMAGISNHLLMSMAICLCACGEKTSGLLPVGELHHLEDYHCWPYDVSVYAMEGVQADPALQGYPLKDYFDDRGEYEISQWSNYHEIDTALWNGMDSTLKECDRNTELYRSLLSGGPVYYAGMYRRMITANGREKRKYQELIFLDLANDRLHVFKDINKVF